MKPHSDYNPIIYDGTPNSVASTVEPCTLCNLLVIDMMSAPQKALAPIVVLIMLSMQKPIVFSWDLFVIESHEKLTVLKLVLIQGISALMIGSDGLQYADVDNNEHHLSFKRPTENLEEFSLHTLRMALKTIGELTFLCYRTTMFQKKPSRNDINKKGGSCLKEAS